MDVVRIGSLLCLLGMDPVVASPSQWVQQYDPAHLWWVSALLAAVPLLLLLTLMLVVRMKVHRAALLTLAVALAIAVGVFHMPAKLAVASSILGFAYGLFPIFWIVFPVIFMYELTVKTGRFALLQQCLSGVTADSRLQLLLIAFAFGAFFEGASGFGTPVAVCGTLLIGLGFAPVEAAAMALLANTAPVAFGALGTPLIALGGVTGLDNFVLTRAIATLLTPFCILVPFWLITVFAGFRRMLEVWPAVLLAGALFGFAQLAVAVFHGPWLVDIAASIITIAALLLLFRAWKPRTVLGPNLDDLTHSKVALVRPPSRVVVQALAPWLILTAFVALWGSTGFAHALDHLSSAKIPMPLLHRAVLRTPPAVPAAAAEPAIFTLNWLSATGTGIFLAALVSAAVMRMKPVEVLEIFKLTVIRTRFTLITIGTLMAFGYLDRYCGLDAVLGLAFARTGVLYPFFGTLIGWIGVASTGSDTSANVLFGSLQKLTAQQLGISPVLMAAANSGGGVMGKMIAPQSVVVASTATGTYGREGSILRRVIVHSIALAALMGLLVTAAVHIPALLRLIVP